jgi:hypothetical protein
MRVYGDVGAHALEEGELRLLSGLLISVMERLGFVVMDEEGISNTRGVQHFGRLDVCDDIYLVPDVDENSYVGPAVALQDFMKQEVWPDVYEAGAEHFPLIFQIPEGRDPVEERIEEGLNLMRARRMLEELLDPGLVDDEEPPELVEEDQPRHTFNCIVC